VNKEINMKRFIIGVLVGFFLIGTLCSCESNRFEVRTTITPKVTMIGDRIAVEYKLGDLLILDEWKGLNIAELLYLSNDKSIKNLNLIIIASDGIDGTYFYYTYGNISVKTDPINWSTLYRNADSFPGVKWLVLNDETIAKGQPDKKIEVKKDEKGEKTKTNNNDQIKWFIIGVVISAGNWDDIILNEKISIKKKIVFFFICGPIVWTAVSFVYLGFGFYRVPIRNYLKKRNLDKKGELIING
jgi:hypothetical protein